MKQHRTTLAALALAVFALPSALPDSARAQDAEGEHRRGVGEQGSLHRLGARSRRARAGVVDARVGHGGGDLAMRVP